MVNYRLLQPATLPDSGWNFQHTVPESASGPCFLPRAALAVLEVQSSNLGGETCALAVLPKNYNSVVLWLPDR